MDYRFLGETGLKVSEMCLGAMTFGWTTEEEDIRRIMDRSVEAGGNFTDTADVYSGANPKRLSAAGSGPSLATKW